jgi:ABC-type dipeptide/oligopeptide/nickel transport system permease subunit
MGKEESARDAPKNAIAASEESTLHSTGSANSISGAFKRLLDNPSGLFSISYLVFITVACVVGPELFELYGVDYTTGHLNQQYQPPGWPHIFGTDLHGRDVLLRILYGGRVSLSVGFVATFVSLVIGVTWGLIAGYTGGYLDTFMMRIVDALYALPFLFLVILLMSLVDLKTLETFEIMILLFVALGAVQWLTMSRIVRGEVISLKEQAFVQGGRALGATNTTIVLRYLLPNILAPVLVYASLTLPQIVLQEAFLSFLGLGIQPPYPSWGSMMESGASALNPIQSRWWLILFPSLFLAGTLLSLNLLGDNLRDILDPHESTRTT